MHAKVNSVASTRDQRSISGETVSVSEIPSSEIRDLSFDADQSETFLPMLIVVDVKTLP
jgi:hypothetical protein